MRQSNDPNYLRLQLVRFAHQHRGKPAAHAFATPSKTVCKRLRRWQAQGYAGLQDPAGRTIKAAWRLLEQIDLDTKDLDDIPPLWPQIRRLGLPLIQYTAREVVSACSSSATPRNAPWPVPLSWPASCCRHQHHTSPQSHPLGRLPGGQSKSPESVVSSSGIGKAPGGFHIGIGNIPAKPAIGKLFEVIS